MGFQGHCAGGGRRRRRGKGRRREGGREKGEEGGGGKREKERDEEGERKRRREKEVEEGEGSGGGGGRGRVLFWYQGRKTSWEEVVCRDDASQQEKTSSTVMGSLPPEGHRGGHLGARGPGVWRATLGERPPWPPTSRLLLSVSCSREGGAPGCLTPRLPCAPRRPDHSHPEAPPLRYSLGGAALQSGPPPPAVPPPISWAQVGGFTSFWAFGDSPARPSPRRPLGGGP